jgi:DNA-binding transcriptional regulator YhcF (GntR family)
MVYIVQENLNEEKSIYLQISEMIENDILKGSLAEEERVPSTNELARFYKINPATAMKGCKYTRRRRNLI